jgi:hypothetical protein
VDEQGKDASHHDAGRAADPTASSDGTAEGLVAAVLANQRERHRQRNGALGVKADPELTRAGLIVAAAGAAVTGLAAADDPQAAIPLSDRHTASRPSASR